MPNAPTIISDSCSAVRSSLGTGHPLDNSRGPRPTSILRSCSDSRQHQMVQPIRRSYSAWRLCSFVQRLSQSNARLSWTSVTYPCSACHLDDGLALAHRLGRQTSDLVGFGQPRQQQKAHQDNTRRPKHRQPEDYGANRAHVRSPRSWSTRQVCGFSAARQAKTVVQRNPARSAAGAFWGSGGCPTSAIAKNES
jgi:hypothetical protein